MDQVQVHKRRRDHNRIAPPTDKPFDNYPEKMKAYMLRERNCFQAEWRTARRDTFTPKNTARNNRRSELQL